MNDDFATALRRSLDLTRAGDLDAATRQIQAALGGNAPAAQATGTARRARQPLGETLADLMRKRTPGSAPAAAPLPEGARFVSRQHTGPHGARRYMLYIPACEPKDLRGLVVMLHGCTQTPEDFARGTAMNTQAEAHRMLVAYPEQGQGDNMNRCWNWFEPAHQDGTRGEPALLADIAQALGEEFALPHGATFVAGLSAGGAMAAILGTERPDVFRGVGVHSGLAPGAARTMQEAFAAMQGNFGTGARALSAPSIVFHGTADPTVAAVNGDRLAADMQGAMRRQVTEGGRGCTVTEGLSGEGHPLEYWRIDGARHAWSGGDPTGSHTDGQGPDASAEMMRFFTTLTEVTQ